MTRFLDVTGMIDYAQKWPGSTSHCEYYHPPQTYVEKEVMIAWYVHSGLDIPLQIAGYARCPVYVSSRAKSQLTASEDQQS